jgi:fatty acid desaturase
MKIISNIETYTRSEVLKHNKIDDCWIIVRNKIYNITSFIKQHPGGQDILMSRAGEDATSFFTMKHGGDQKIEKMLSHFYIGELTAKEGIADIDFEEPFITELIEVIKTNNLTNVAKSTKVKFDFMRIIAVLLFFTLSIMAIYNFVPVWLSITFIAFQALIGISLFGFIAHEATHRNFPKNKMLNHLLTIVWPIIWPFISRKPLVYEHNSHHFKIGDKDFDFEVAGFAKLIRYSSKVRLSFWHRYQHKLAALWYPFYANIITTIGGFKSSFWIKHNRNIIKYHFLSIVATFAYFVLIPSLIQGFAWYLVFYYLVYQMILFSGIYVGAAINHFIPNALELMPKAFSNKYGYYICHHTSNFGVNSSFWFWFTGGFNIQIEHHLAPFIPVENLRASVPLIKSLCHKHNYPYHNFSGLKELWNAHYNYLEKLSKNESFEEEIQNKELYKAR